jgi:hypothetical protein
MHMTKTNALDRELEAYRKALPELLAQEGKFVLIHDEKVIDTFDSYADALKRGYAVAGLAPFLVKRISGTETVAYFTRDFGIPCQA